MDEIYISTDIESDGPIPGLYSMLNFGSVAITKNKKIISTFERNLERLPDAEQHYDTMQFWDKNPKAYAYVTSNTVNPKTAMQDYSEWLTELSKDYKLVFLAYPAGFDFTFIKWYMEYFNGKCEFGFQALDIRSYAMGKLGTTYGDSIKRNYPNKWFDHTPLDHTGLSDAISQGMMFINMMND